MMMIKFIVMYFLSVFVKNVVVNVFVSNLLMYASRFAFVVST